MPMLVAVALSGAGLIVWLAWWWPRQAVALLLVIMPAYLLRFRLVGIPTNVFELGVVVVFLVALLRAEQRRWLFESVVRLPSLLKWCLLVFVGASVISTAISAQLLVSLGILKGWVVVPMLLGWLVCSTLFSVGRSGGFLILVNTYIKALLFSGVAMALVGLSQIGNLERLQGVYDVPNSLALWLAPLIVLAVWRGVESNSRLDWLLAAPMLLVFVLTQSAMGLFSVVAALALGVFVWLKGFKKSMWIGVLIFFIAISIFALDALGKLSYLLQPLNNPGATNSVTVRQQLWSVSRDILQKHSILGIGLGQFEPAYQAALHKRFAEYNLVCSDMEKGGNFLVCRRAPQPEFVFRDPHNWILSFWLNTGLVGLAGFALLNMYVLARSFKIRSIAPVSQQAVTLALVSMLVFGLADTIYWKNDLASLHWSLFFIVAVLCFKSISPQTADE